MCRARCMCENAETTSSTGNARGRADHLSKHRAESLRLVFDNFHQIEDFVRHVAAKLRRLPGRPDATLSDLDEPAASSQGPHTLPDELLSQRVEYDVDPLAAGDLHDLIGERQRA
jgi:hypothetical protein